MSNLARLGVAIVALLMVGIVGFNLTRPNGIGPAGATPVPTPIHVPTAAPPSPTATPAAYTWPAPLAAGTYTTSLVWDVPFTTTFTAPAGWQAFDIEITKEPVMYISFDLVDNVYQDPCAKVPIDPPIGPNVSDLAEGLRSDPSLLFAHSEGVEFAGATGRYVELHVRPDPPCALDAMSLWHEAVDKAKSGLPLGGPDEEVRYANHRIWILDVGALRYVIDAASSDDATAADLAEQQQILDSIRISEPPRTADCSVTLIDSVTRSEQAGPPYVATLNAGTNDLRGPAPSPLPSFNRPLARIDFTAVGDAWPPPGGANFRLLVRLTPPAGVDTTGFATSTGVNGLQGSMILDAPGAWLAELEGVNPACPHTFLVSVSPIT